VHRRFAGLGERSDASCTFTAHTEKLLSWSTSPRFVGVSRQRASVLSRRIDFPEPGIGTGHGWLWAAGEVRAWARTYDSGDRRWGARSVVKQRESGAREPTR
jgi:hypothetical protein